MYKGRALRIPKYRLTTGYNLTAHDLREALMDGTAEEVNKALEALHKAGVVNHKPKDLFANDKSILITLCSRLTRAKTWAEFDELFDVVLKQVPEIKTLKTPEGHTFASSLILFASEYQENPYRTKTMLVKLKDKGFDLSSADSELRPTFKGEEVKRMINATRAERQK